MWVDGIIREMDWWVDGVWVDGLVDGGVVGGCSGG